ncbi:MAG: RNA-binding cell elongation regulator Jag/EloR [Actinomycetota bacterium]|nr:RNA-binding cell elongation regulator Jag/EloR [Actinomycetota bacterium]
MEWVETTGKTIAEAKEKALDQLGVLEEDADFDVLEEPKQGLFGRVRGEARVRARVRPTQARQKVDRRDRKRSEKAAATGDDAVATADRAPRQRAPKAAGAKKSPAKAAAAGSAVTATKERTDAPRAARAPKPTTPKPSQDSETKEQLVDPRQVGEEAVRFMTELVTAFGLSGTAELVEDGDDLEVRVHGQELGLLVGPRGTTLQAVQDLARVASQRRLGDHDTRLRIDVGGYRERRRVALGAFAAQMADEVKSSGVARVLEPMSSADRKVIHDSLSETEGIATRSEGDDPYRRVIIAPANG